MRLRIVIALCVGLAAAMPAVGQPTGEIPSAFDGVGIDEQLGAQVPLDIPFRDEDGREVRLAEYFDGERPVILNLVYHDCPMLCSLILTEFTRTLGEMAWQPGREFDVLTVSFSAVEMPDLAARAKERFVGQLGRPGAEDGWHFLTGDDASIQALAAAVGFKFKWIESTQEYAHPAALMFLSGTGKVTRYIHGMGFRPDDVRKALVEAADGTVGTTVDKILLYCYRYDADANSYVLHAQNLMKAGGAATILLLVSTLFYFWRREKRRLHTAAA